MNDDHLSVYEDNYSVWRICWIVDYDQGMTLGEDNVQQTLSKGRSDVDNGDDEHYLATRSVHTSYNVKHDNDGFFWQNKKDVMAALKLAKLAIKNKNENEDDWPDWAKKALAKGWKPPKGWGSGQQ